MPRPAPHNMSSFKRTFLFYYSLLPIFYDIYSFSSLFGLEQLARKCRWGSVNFILPHIHHECLSLGAVQKLILPQAAFLLTHSSLKPSKSSCLPRCLSPTCSGHVLHLLHSVLDQSVYNPSHELILQFLFAVLSFLFSDWVNAGLHLPVIFHLFP